MPLCADELKELIIVDCLHYLDLGLSESEFKAAEALLLGTAAQESGLGYQMHCGRRLGLYLISPALHRSVWDNYLIHHPDLASKIRGMAGQHSFLANPHGELVSNLKYATAIAMMVYLRANQPLPTHTDLQALASYWHRHFHPKTSQTTADFIKNYRALFPTKHLVAA